MTDMQELAALRRSQATEIERLRIALEMHDLIEKETHAENERLRALSVESILLDVTPGWDGMGQEIYAKSVAQVEAKLCEMGERTESLEAERDRLRAELDAAKSRIELLEHDAKTGDYETLYAQTVAELQVVRAELDALQGREPVRLCFPAARQELWAGWEVQKWIDSQGPVYLHPQPAIPEVLFDGYAVYQELGRAQARTSPENVSDVLDSVVRLLRSR